MTPRHHHYNKFLKDRAQAAIVERYTQYGLETYKQHFETGIPYCPSGVNIIAILPGKNRNRILVVGAHYDTMFTAGIDDNASGSVLTLELARMLSNLKGKLDHTIIFVNFDLEEAGVLGSYAFVREHLIPNELIERKATFLGAYCIDMVLNYNTSANSQQIPEDTVEEAPRAAEQISQNGYRGDFLAFWSRRGQDNKLVDAFRKKWDGEGKYNLIDFDADLPDAEYPSTFKRSDHASFWFHNHPTYTENLSSILLTDMGVWRGEKGPRCYHQECDDVEWLKEPNLKFMKKTLDTLARVVTSSFE